MEIRPLEGLDEFQACVGIQRDTWGADFGEIVPPTILKVSQRIGGVVSGAFEDGALVGFVFGMTGWEEGRPVHWSDMLAVRKGSQGRGIGERLKWHQRSLLLGRGVEVMYWSFDPLQAKNGYLNLQRLGATSREYVKDMYGLPSSHLHAGIGTDRLVARWDLMDPDVVRRAQGGVDRTVATAGPGVPAFSWSAPDGIPVPGQLDRDARPATVRVPIPESVDRLKVESPGVAGSWRSATREALVHLLEIGYTVSGFSQGTPVSEYVLQRD